VPSGVEIRENVFVLICSYFGQGYVDRRMLRLHVGEPVRLGPAVAAKKEGSVQQHVRDAITTPQTSREVEE
jgi:hypothetical protein